MSIPVPLQTYEHRYIPKLKKVLSLGFPFKILQQNIYIYIFLALTEAVSSIKPFLAKNELTELLAADLTQRRDSARPVGACAFSGTPRPPARRARTCACVRGHVGRRRGGACGTRVVAAAMAAVSGSVRLQRCVVSPAGRHSASLIFLHGSGGFQFYILVPCPLGNTLPAPSPPPPAGGSAGPRTPIGPGGLGEGGCPSVAPRRWARGQRGHLSPGVPLCLPFFSVGVTGPASWLPAYVPLGTLASPHPSPPSLNRAR